MNTQTVIPQILCNCGNVSNIAENKCPKCDLEFDNGMRLRLPENSIDFGPTDAWKKFIEMQSEFRVLDREIKVLDMRLKDRVGIKLTKVGLKTVKLRKKNSKT